MERSRIAIFEKFPLISVVIPYYGYAHSGFLVLSTISKKTRFILMENYEIFRRIMFQYLKERKVKDNEEQSMMMYLPYDLFKFSLKISANRLIELALKLESKEGCYFGEHYMSDHICLNKIYVRDRDIKDLYLHVDLLESIEVLDNSNQENPLKSSLLKQIVIENVDIFDYRRCKGKNYSYFEDKHCKKTNHIFQHFKRFGLIYTHIKHDTDHIIKKIQQADIDELDCLDIDELKVDNPKLMLNPDNYNFKLCKLSLTSMDHSLLEDIDIENITKINIKTLQLSKLESTSVAYNILSSLPNNMIVQFGRISSDEYTLKFVNTEVLLMDENELKCLHSKEVKFYFSEISKENILFINEKYIGIKSNEMEVSYFKKSNKIPNFEPGALPYEYNNASNLIIIPISNLIEIRLTLSKLCELLQEDKNKAGFSSLPSSTNVVIKMESNKNALKFVQISEHVPNHSKLELKFDYYSDEIYSEDNKCCEELVNFFEIVTKYKIKSLWYKRESIQDTERVINILSHSSTQHFLKHIKCFDVPLLECQSILSLCNKCMFLENIHIKCIAKKNDENDEEIIKAKKRIRQCCNNIQSINVDFKYISKSRSCSKSENDSCSSSTSDRNSETRKAKQSRSRS